MVHPVKIESYVPGGAKPGSLTFLLDGRRMKAVVEHDCDEAREVWKSGAEYPVALTLVARGKVDYAEPGTPGLTLTRQAGLGDVMRFLGRTWQSIDHATVLLQTEPQVALRLAEPQFATDFRGGSWLTGEGVLTAALPEDHHD
ncbi:MAG: hypothetical protein HUU03_11515 [Planctomycetaceae bacterium]|nr:hypothetical protein [Planctomycetota bacterium]NUO17056.1 hypothetical protein [Planctomycetaceae bacterium]GIK53856.1 MAG: hypothetical protein BroJett014_28290 [Planctomycetota bacterium]